ncbi:hypothetical protein B0T25DRAFT_294089 [Lasiosphaeria hispida]|uniref:Uncharacterized protein n=1 Tax=Lasiosphaeria hispida TaxID=260671 RepID=A0AAJ0HD10_9PEZI|nr:hypothetical protein B0T25DRAFT_294089 [Lasiosphaeria hispida]
MEPSAPSLIPASAALFLWQASRNGYSTYRVWCVLACELPFGVLVEAWQKSRVKEKEKSQSHRQRLPEPLGDLGLCFSACQVCSDTTHPPLFTLQPLHHTHLIFRRPSIAVESLPALRVQRHPTCFPFFPRPAPACVMLYQCGKNCYTFFPQFLVSRVFKYVAW